MRISDWSSDVCSSDLAYHGQSVLLERQIDDRLDRPERLGAVNREDLATGADYESIGSAGPAGGAGVLEVGLDVSGVLTTPRITFQANLEPAAIKSDVFGNSREQCEVEAVVGGGYLEKLLSVGPKRIVAA